LLDGGFGGNDVLTGLAGADTFVFHGGDGIITDFDQGGGAFNQAEGDLIDVSGLNGGNGFSNFAELEALFSQSAGDTIVTFEGGNSLTLVGVNFGNLSGTDFILHV
jgi:hypothetical protein